MVDTATALQQLTEVAAKTHDPNVSDVARALGDVVSAGNVSSSVGVAIGHNIRQVVNQYNLPPEAADALLDLRVMLGDRARSRYQPI